MAVFIPILPDTEEGDKEISRIQKEWAQRLADAMAKGGKEGGEALDKEIKQIARSAAKSDATLAKMLTTERVRDARDAFGDLKDVFEKSGASLLGFNKEQTESAVLLGDLVEHGSAAGLVFGPLAGILGGVLAGALGVLSENTRITKEKQDGLTKSMREEATVSKSLQEEIRRTGKARVETVRAVTSAIDDMIKKQKELRDVSQGGVFGFLFGGQKTQGSFVDQELQADEAEKVLDGIVAAAQGGRDAITGLREELGFAARDAGKVKQEFISAQDAANAADERLRKLKKDAEQAQLSGGVVSKARDLTKELESATKDQEEATERLRKASDTYFEVFGTEKAQKPEKTFKGIKKAADEATTSVKELSAATLGMLQREEVDPNLPVFALRLDDQQSEVNLSQSLQEVILGIEGEIARGNIKGIEVPIYFSEDRIARAIEQAKELQAQYEDVLQGTLVPVVDAVFSHFSAAIENGNRLFEGFGKSVARGVSDALKAIGRMMGVKSLEQLAEGWAKANSVFLAWQAPGHFKSAALFAAGAAAAGVGGALAGRIAGGEGGGRGAAGRPSAGGGGGSSSPSLGRSADRGPTVQAPTTVVLQFHSTIPPTQREQEEAAGRVLRLLDGYQRSGGTFPRGLRGGFGS